MPDLQKFHISLVEILREQISEIPQHIRSTQDHAAMLVARCGIESLVRLARKTEIPEQSIPSVVDKLHRALHPLTTKQPVVAPEIIALLTQFIGELHAKTKDGGFRCLVCKMIPKTLKRVQNLERPFQLQCSWCGFGIDQREMTCDKCSSFPLVLNGSAWECYHCDTNSVVLESTQQRIAEQLAEIQ